MHSTRKRVALRALELYDLYPQLDFEDALSGATMEVNVLGKLGRTPNTRVCLEADGACFRQLLMHVLGGD
jgi:hypothetical protein